MRVVMAPDSFKGTVAAADVASALAQGWADVRRTDEVVECPQADGGEGTLEAVAANVPSAERRRVEGVRGPDGRPTTGVWLMLPDGTAVVELAQVCGLPMMRAPNAGGASTFGLGQVIRAAMAGGARCLCVALGGSASTDGGAGALRALRMGLYDGRGDNVPEGGRALHDLARVDAADLIAPPAGGVELLADTTAVLSGPGGAAETFAPQKGADPETVRELDVALARFSRVLGRVLHSEADAPGAGAAGGTAFGLAAWASGAGGKSVDAARPGAARPVITPGAQRIGELTGLTDLLDRCEVVVTGEGRFDRTSSSGKLVGSVLHRCAGRPVTSVVVAGRLDMVPPVMALALDEIAGSVEGAMRDPRRWLVAAGAEAARRVETNTAQVSQTIQIRRT